MTTVVLIVSLLVMLMGLAGTLVPVLPGIPVIWAAMLFYGWFTGWSAYGLMAMTATGVLVLISVVVDQLASVIGAKRFGATRAGLIGSVVGAIAGLIVFNVIGLIMGTFIGAMSFEIIFSRRNFRESMTSGFGALVGFLAGSLFKFMLALGLIVYFVFALILN